MNQNSIVEAIFDKVYDLMPIEHYDIDELEGNISFAIKDPSCGAVTDSVTIFYIADGRLIAEKHERDNANKVAIKQEVEISLLDNRLVEKLIKYITLPIDSDIKDLGLLKVYNY